MLRVYASQINKTLSLLLGGIFQDNNFLDTLLFICSICLFALKILGLEKIMGHQTYVPPEL